MTTYESALAAWEKIKTWSEKEYAEATLLENNFYYGTGVKKMYLLVKITDPTAVAIEQIVADRQKREFGRTVPHEWLYRK